MEKTGLRKEGRGVFDNRSKVNRSGKVLLFAAGQGITLAFICVLQFFNPKENLGAFVGILLGMHIGILCFILSKKLFPTQADPKLKAHYLLEYGMLVPYLGLMAAAIAGVTWNHRVKLWLVFGYTAAAAVVSVFNTVFFIKKLRNEVVDHG